MQNWTEFLATETHALNFAFLLMLCFTFYLHHVAPSNDYMIIWDDNIDNMKRFRIPSTAYVRGIINNQLNCLQCFRQFSTLFWYNSTIMSSLHRILFQNHICSLILFLANSNLAFSVFEAYWSLWRVFLHCSWDMKCFWILVASTTVDEHGLDLYHHPAGLVWIYFFFA